VSEQLGLLPAYLTGHLQLTLLALTVGLAISLPLGILAARRESLERAVLGAASVIQTIPSLALLAVMVPLLAALQVQSIGYLPAFIGLTLYSLLPMLRNTVTGLAGLDESLTEAARAVGMTPRQQLWRVELPLAAPVIVAGIRTSAVWVVGTATLSTPVGATSLGNYIFSGLQTRNLTAVLVGCVAAALLALALDGTVRALEMGVRRRSRALAGAGSAVLAALCVSTVVATAAQSWGRGGQRPVVIGAKTFTEQYILSEMLARHIARETGAPTQVRASLGSTVAFDALRSGDIDVYVDYSGTIWATIMRRETLGADRERVLVEMEEYLREEHDITLVSALGFENAYAMAMPRAAAERLGVTKVSDLARHAGALTMGGDYEFFARPEWRALEEIYGLNFAERRSMDASLMYQAAAQGSVQVISAFSTDGRIEALDLVVLVDDRQVIPPYDAVILTGPRVARERPDVITALQGLTGSIDAPAMRRMNLAVDRNGEEPGAVAQAFLERLGGADMTDTTIQAAQQELTDSLGRHDNVVGTAIGLCAGTPCIKVYLIRDDEALRRRIPDTFRGFAVDVEVTGRIRPRDRNP
jgi:osmoprotectant transport system permease protein